MRNNPEGGELDSEVYIRRRCRKNFLSALSCIKGKRTKEGCDRGNEVRTFHNGRGGEGSVLLRKPKESGRRENYEKDSVASRR